MTIFITQELRNSEGLCQPVCDVVMENSGIERKGSCEACGHEIKNHFGVKLPSGQFLYVGSDCKQILCRPDAIQINPNEGLKFNNQYGKIQIVISESWVKRLGDYIFQTGIVHDKYTSWEANFSNNYNGAYYTGRHNQFLASIYSQAVENKKYSGFYFLSEKQIQAVENQIK